jgi:hypothetical protein
VWHWLTEVLTGWRKNLKIYFIRNWHSLDFFLYVCIIIWNNFTQTKSNIQNCLRLGLKVIIVTFGAFSLGVRVFIVLAKSLTTSCAMHVDGQSPWQHICLSGQAFQVQYFHVIKWLLFDSQVDFMSHRKLLTIIKLQENYSLLK